MSSARVQPQKGLKKTDEDLIHTQINKDTIGIHHWLTSTQGTYLSLGLSYHYPRNSLSLSCNIFVLIVHCGFRLSLLHVIILETWYMLVDMEMMSGYILKSWILTRWHTRTSFIVTQQLKCQSEALIFWFGFEITSSNIIM